MNCTESYLPRSIQWIAAKDEKLRAATNPCHAKTKHDDQQ